MSFGRFRERVVETGSLLFVLSVCVLIDGSCGKLRCKAVSCRIGCRRVGRWFESTLWGFVTISTNRQVDPHFPRIGSLGRPQRRACIASKSPSSPFSALALVWSRAASPAPVVHLPRAAWVTSPAFAALPATTQPPLALSHTLDRWTSVIAIPPHPHASLGNALFYLRNLFRHRRAIPFVKPQRPQRRRSELIG